MKSAITMAITILIAPGSACTAATDGTKNLGVIARAMPPQNWPQSRFNRIANENDSRSIFSAAKRFTSRAGRKRSQSSKIRTRTKNVPNSYQNLSFR